jgi:hypothetical protein
VFCACENKQKPGDFAEEEAEKMTIRVTSPTFEEGDMIPPKYTSDGEDVSPPLNWEGVHRFREPWLRGSFSSERYTSILLQNLRAGYKAWHTKQLQKGRFA